MKTLLKRTLRGLGYELRRIPGRAGTADSPALPAGTADFERAAREAAGIPSMLRRQTAFFLYALCYLQELAGDVVEVGSWQGYSTAFLASAVRDSGNGIVHAVDHFRGNVGKEQHYVVGRPDLADLRAGFESNLRERQLWSHVRLLDMPNEEAVQHLQGICVRLLFIDGDHTEAGVERDIRLFFPMVRAGGIVVFDDYSPQCPGLMRAVSRMIEAHKPERVAYFDNTLVLRKRGGEG
ncbi:MAG TPA: class I SAM-dependent methyltransferase [Burkholderiales bacterium]|nr:class I SAM-dependent methyltransferase [Burkholderiales bacterium]